MPLSEKYFIYYCRISIKEGLNTDLKTSELMLGKYDKEVYRSCRQCHCVIEIKKINLSAICVLNFYKIKTESTLEYILYRPKTNNIGFSQTFIVHLPIVYSDIKISKINLVEFLKK